jgi:hypothetical protein
VNVSAEHALSLIELSPGVLSHSCVTFQPTLSAPAGKVTDSYFPTGENTIAKL